MQLSAIATLSAISTAMLSALPAVAGHGYIVDPPAVWAQGYPSNGYTSTVDNAIWGEMDGATYGYGPEGALKYWETNFPKSDYATMRDLLAAEQTVLTEYGANADCGLTIQDESQRQKLPATLQWSGFTHPGPCEIWCDDVKLTYALDCQTTYASGDVPIDTTKCTNADRLTTYWIGVHGEPWQVYTDCVWLTSGSGDSSPTDAPTDAPTNAPTNAPTDAPTEAPTNAPTDAPTDAPVATPAPNNCVRRRFRERN